MKLTINEIARLANVSKSTVSKVLNNYPGINKNTREKVLKIVKETQYEPNIIARALSSKKTGNIGLLIPHSPEHTISGAYWTTFISRITIELSAHDYNLLLLLPHEEGKLEDIFRLVLKRGIVDGLIIGSECLDRHWLSELKNNNIPFVMLGKNPDFTHYSVDIDNEDAACKATEHLIEQGYRRIALIAGPINFYYNSERAKGYRKAITTHSLEYSRELYLPYDNYQRLREEVESIITGAAPADALLVTAGGDFMLEVLDSIKKTGRKPPQTGFVSFDDYRYLDHINPPVSAVSQPMVEMSKASVDILVKLLKKQEPEEKEVFFKAKLNIRKSSLKNRN
ncbi:LacI family DNA-binding transcriptional regulator [Spirochaetia bacterium 38H-sp]|uniref:LacI family DNA-binding transcriptional regulator n=1 Tax=Rarispira pelagica TaxID=3141764 RepID=A0ABU9U8V2_9SPIR